MPTVALDALSPAQMAALQDQLARAMRGRGKLKPHLNSPYTGACTRCGTEQGVTAFCDGAAGIPMGGEFHALDAQTRAWAARGGPSPAWERLRAHVAAQQ